MSIEIHVYMYYTILTELLNNLIIAERRKKRNGETKKERQPRYHPQMDHLSHRTNQPVESTD